MLGAAPRLVFTAIFPAISGISTSAIAGFFLPEEEVQAAKVAYEKGGGGLVHLNFRPRALEEGAAYYYPARGAHPCWSNDFVAWRRTELVSKNVPKIVNTMTKPYLGITGENAWCRQASIEVFEAVPGENKQLPVIDEVDHFDRYDLSG